MPPTNASLQVAEGIENFKMQSPLKKPVFTSEEKENVSSDDVAVPIKGIPLDYEPAVKEMTVAETIRKEEADEPILQENPQRFVLFPIKYHEVRDSSRDAFSTRKLEKKKLTLVPDLEHVQEGRSILLDCRGD